MQPDLYKETLWGEPTSTMDWCEANYEYTFFIAEFWNTLSNLFIIFFGLLGLLLATRKYPQRFLWSYLGLVFVGIGSFAFHCTLSWQGQLLDEMPMMICTQPLLYSFIALKIKDEKKLKIIRNIIISIQLIVIPTYIFLQWYLLFLFVFGGSMTYVLYKGYRESRNILKEHNNVSTLMPNNPKTLFNRGCTAYLVGFSFWIADQVFCNHLNDLKAEVGPILQPFLEFHCYWHLFAGYGCYLFVLTVQVIYSIKYKHDVEFREYCHIKGKTYSFQVCSLLTSWLPIVRPIDGVKDTADIEKQDFVELNETHK